MAFGLRRAKVLVRAISFQDFQPMWSWSTNVTDGQTGRQTDRQTDGRTICHRKIALCTIVRCAVKIDIKSQHLLYNLFHRRLRRCKPMT